MPTSDTISTRTLARLSFWVPPERMAEFEAAYEAKVAPILKKHGLVASSERGRAVPENVFSRLFEVEMPSDVAEKREALQSDPAWEGVLRDLETAFGKEAWLYGSLQYNFGIYVAPAGSGKAIFSVQMRGHWRTYDGADGLADHYVRSMLQDREGYIWFGTENGVSRYNGQRFTPFSTQDGLVCNLIWRIFQDRDGNLWFSTIGEYGVSRYDGKSFTTFTTQDGLPSNHVRSMFQDQEGNIWFGTNRHGVSRYSGKAFITFTTQEGLAGNSVFSILQDREGHLWFGTWGGVSRYDGKTFTTFTTKDGLAHNGALEVLQDQEGQIWVGTYGGGVSRYDGKTFTTFTKKDGLVSNYVRSMLQDREGNIWIGTEEGLSCYDGNAFTAFTEKDGLVHHRVFSILQDREGHLWFATGGGGVSRYDVQMLAPFSFEGGLVGSDVRSIFQDPKGHLWFGTHGNGVIRFDGETWTVFSTHDGLASNQGRFLRKDREGHLWFGTRDCGVSRYDGKTWTTFTLEDGMCEAPLSFLQDKEGNLWFGTQGDGVICYDGNAFVPFTVKDGLGHNQVDAILQDREGNLWFGTWGGASRYNGRAFVTFTEKDGLANRMVHSILQDREGYFWFGTYGGVSRYDGRAWTTFNVKDGLAHNVVLTVFQDREGHLWFGTWGGVSRFDGQVFQKLTQQDGLLSNAVWSIFQDREGILWFGTSKGPVCFRPPAPVPPPVFVDAVVADQRYEKAADVSISSSVRLTAFEFHGMSFKTRPDAMVYRYRLKGYEEEWHNTRERRVEYQDLPIGEYEFEVLAVDRDLVYSEKPAMVRLTVVRDSRDEQIDELERRVRERTRELEETHRRLQETQAELIAELEKELQTAHEMQMGLMPRGGPQVEGFEVAGRCFPANHVGGDFFQYFEQPGALTVCLADVTGHAMEAAIPVVMFSGILKSQMEQRATLQERFGRLNRSLYGTLTGRTLVCLAMGEIDLSSRRLALSDSGCPYPYHYRAATGEAVELAVDAYPLGVRRDMAYPVIEAQLEAGDRVVFCSDGVMEAVNGSGEQFGYDRTAEVIRTTCGEGLSAEGTLQRVLGAVERFRGGASQMDDITCVVVRVLDPYRRGDES